MVYSHSWKQTFTFHLFVLSLSRFTKLCGKNEALCKNSTTALVSISGEIFKYLK